MQYNLRKLFIEFLRTNMITLAFKLFHPINFSFCLPVLGQICMEMVLFCWEKQKGKPWHDSYFHSRSDEVVTPALAGDKQGCLGRTWHQRYGEGRSKGHGGKVRRGLGEERAAAEKCYGCHAPQVLLQHQAALPGKTPPEPRNTWHRTAFLKVGSLDHLHIH